LSESRSFSREYSSASGGKGRGGDSSGKTVRSIGRKNERAGRFSSSLQKTETGERSYKGRYGRIPSFYPGGRAGRKKIFSGRRDAGTNFGFYSRMLWRIRMVYGCFRKMGGFSKADPGSRTLAVFSIHGCSQVFGRTCFCISHCILERIVSCL